MTTNERDALAKLSPKELAQIITNSRPGSTQSIAAIDLLVEVNRDVSRRLAEKVKSETNAAVHPARSSPQSKNAHNPRFLTRTADGILDAESVKKLEKQFLGRRNMRKLGNDAASNDPFEKTLDQNADETAKQHDDPAKQPTDKQKR